MSTATNYAVAALERQGGFAPAGRSGRSDFLRDRDRVLYSSAVRALAGKTQVVSTSEFGNYHNRLTHSLKVAQLGRAIATRLSATGAGPDPDLVEAACLAHDIGHPPFGHAGENALSYALYKLRCAERGSAPFGREKDDPVAVDGFEGNAQNLRVLTYLSIHADGGRGLHLSRATLAACTKYPWMRADEGKPRKKWGAYEAERDTLEWLLEARPEGGPERPVEADLMNWCDDVTYACHDMEDFYRQGSIPLETLFDFDVTAEDPVAPRDENPELSRFLDFVSDDWNEQEDGPFDRQEAVLEFHRLNDLVSVTGRYRATRSSKAALKQTVTDLISHFVDDVKVTGDSPVWYTGTLVVSDEKKFGCALLKKLIWFYVIRQSNFAAQQRGQERVIDDLVSWYAEDAPRLLPPDRLEELNDHQDIGRAVADHVATTSESQALALHHRLSGHDLGHVTDAL